jgi:hypothetical protein
MAHEVDPHTEWQRLYELYHAMPDADLLELAEKLDDLTEIARDVLGREVESRGIQSVPVREVAESSPSSSKGIIPGLVWLDSYNDAINARSACEHLDAAGIAFEIKDYARPRWGLRAEGGPAVDLQLYVEAVDKAKAMTVLHDAMGRFPGPEMEYAQAKKMVLLNDFFDALDAGRACDFLGDAGIGFEIEDLSIRENWPGHDFGSSSILMKVFVQKRTLEAAQGVLRLRMGLFPLQEVVVADEPFDDGTLQTLGEFGTRKEAEVIVRIISGEGLWAKLSDRSDEFKPEELPFEIEVREIDLGKAIAAVERNVDFSGMAED